MNRTEESKLSKSHHIYVEPLSGATTGTISISFFQGLSFLHLAINLQIHHQL